jgi:hypothetical protein
MIPLGPDKIRQSAEREAERLANTSRWRRAFLGAKARDPLLVKARTSRSARNYYIVDFRIGGRSTGRMILDAKSGKVGQVAGLRDEQSELPRFLEPSELPKVLTVIYSKDRQVELRDFRIDPELYWEPSNQSPSPFQPFYVARTAHDIAYVRVDGEVFGNVTRTGAGG